MQNGILDRYFRVDADHDLSGLTLELSTDRASWTSDGVEFVAPEDWPQRVSALTVQEPPEAGMAAYWFKVLTGPGAMPIPDGQVTVYGRVIEAPQTPRFAWTFLVGPYD